MAIKCIYSERNYLRSKPTDEIRKKFVIDSEADVASLPKCCAGSVAIVAEGGKAYMVNASGVWVASGTASFSIAEEASF